MHKQFITTFSLKMSISRPILSTLCDVLSFKFDFEFVLNLFRIVF